MVNFLSKGTDLYLPCYSPVSSLPQTVISYHNQQQLSDTMLYVDCRVCNGYVVFIVKKHSYTTVIAKNIPT